MEANFAKENLARRVRRLPQLQSPRKQNHIALVALANSLENPLAYPLQYSLEFEYPLEYSLAKILAGRRRSNSLNQTHSPPEAR